MENDICNFTIIESPTRRYANTVNLVFFRAIPLYKNFQKYIDGLKRWKGYMTKYYPDSQLQIFVDKTIAADPVIQPILEKMNARIYLFDCPEYKIDDTFHIGLFATMMRFYPIFDINTRPLKIAHVQELEPDDDFVYRFALMDKASRMKFNNKLTFLYAGRRIFEEIDGFGFSFGENINYPWIIAGRFTLFEKIPFELFKNFLHDIDSGKKFFNKYQNNIEGVKIKKEHGNYSFGVDEMFLNFIILPWLIENDKNIGIQLDYKISYPVYYMKEKIRVHPKSAMMLNYILQKNQSVSQSLSDFDNLFYRNGKSERAKQCADRFYQILEKYPEWLGSQQSGIILSLYKGYIERVCVVVVRNNVIVEIKDILI